MRRPTTDRSRPAAARSPHRLYNIGAHQAQPVTSSWSRSWRRPAGKSAIIEPTGMQPGDVKETYADLTAISNDLGFAPTTPARDRRARCSWTGSATTRPLNLSQTAAHFSEQHRVYCSLSAPPHSRRKSEAAVTLLAKVDGSMEASIASTFDVLGWEIELAGARCIYLDKLIGDLMPTIPEEHRQALMEGMHAVDLLSQHLTQPVGLRAADERQRAGRGLGARRRGHRRDHPWATWPTAWPPPWRAGARSRGPWRTGPVLGPV